MTVTLVGVTPQGFGAFSRGVGAAVTVPAGSNRATDCATFGLLSVIGNGTLPWTGPYVTWAATNPDWVKVTEIQYADVGIVIAVFAYTTEATGAIPNPTFSYTGGPATLITATQPHVFRASDAGGYWEMFETDTLYTEDGIKLNAPISGFDPIDGAPIRVVDHYSELELDLHPTEWDVFERQHERVTVAYSMCYRGGAPASDFAAIDRGTGTSSSEPSDVPNMTPSFNFAGVSDTGFRTPTVVSAYLIQDNDTANVDLGPVDWGVSVSSLGTYDFYAASIPFSGLVRRLDNPPLPPYNTSVPVEYGSRRVTLGELPYQVQSTMMKDLEF